MPKVLQAAARHHAEAQHHEAGQVSVFAAQAIVTPMHPMLGRPALLTPVCRNKTPVEWMRQVGFHGTDDGQLVGAGGDVREQLADGHAGFAMGLELPGAFQPLAIAARRGVLGVGERLAVKVRQLGLGVEGIDMRDAAVHETEDDVLGPRPEVGSRRRGRSGGMVRQQPGQSDQAEAIRRAAEQFAAGAREERRIRVVQVVAPGKFLLEEEVVRRMENLLLNLQIGLAAVHTQLFPELRSATPSWA